MKSGSVLHWRALLLGAVLVCAAGSGMAQSAGHWRVKGGFNGIAPQVKGGDLSLPNLPGGKVALESANSLIAGDVSKYQFADGVHPSPYGYQLLAEFVSSKMIAKGWL